jgi:hypothetical protein
MYYLVGMAAISGIVIVLNLIALIALLDAYWHEGE